MMPTIGPKQGKVWGTTQQALKFNGVSSHVLLVDPNAYCSIHLHRSKWNRFYVIEGQLLIRQILEQEGRQIADETLLGPGQITDVPPRVKHQFQALDNKVLAIEYYWTTLDDTDIERFSAGGAP